MTFTNYILLFIVSYLFGSFPSAYLIIKFTSKKDVREQGSGNVGALNAFRTSRNAAVGILVLILDLLKGFLPAWYFTRIMPMDFIFLMALVPGVLAGHVYPVWLKFKGGRGLAVTAGALLALEPTLVLIWMGMWGIFYLLLRKHIVANMVATFLLPVIVFFTRGWLYTNDILLMILPVCMLIFFKHLERIPDLVEHKRISINNGE